MSRRRILGVSLATATVAVLATGFAVGGVFESKGPQLASRASLTDGFAKARLSTLHVATQAAQTPSAQVQVGPEARVRVAALAREAYASEPLNPEALRNLAYVAEAAGRPAEVLTLMQYSLALSKRDLGTNGWFIQHFAKRGEDGEALGAFDRAMRTSTRARAMFINVLLNGVSQDGIVEPLMALLSTEEPVWEQDFWRESYRFPNSARNLAPIRAQRARDGLRADPRVDQALLDNLAGAGEFDLALLLHEALTRTAPPAGEQVRNARFDLKPQFRPFGWALQLDSNVMSAVETGTGMLKVDTYNGAHGLVARQMVKLEDQVYRLKVVTAGWQGRSSEGFTIRFDCAEPGRGGGRSRGLPVNDSSIQASFQKPDPGCRYFWLSLYVLKGRDAPDSSLGFDEISVTSMP